MMNRADSDYWEDKLECVISPEFRLFVNEESENDRLLSLDDLLILSFLLRHREITASEASQICQRSEGEMREVLSTMERSSGYLEKCGTGKGTYWVLNPALFKRLASSRYSNGERRIDWEAAKTRVLSTLAQRKKKGELGLTNSDIRRLTHFTRDQVKRLMNELKAEGVESIGRTRTATWILK